MSKISLQQQQQQQQPKAQIPKILSSGDAYAFIFSEQIKSDDNGFVPKFNNDYYGYCGYIIYNDNGNLTIHSVIRINYEKYIVLITKEKIFYYKKNNKKK